MNGIQGKKYVQQIGTLKVTYTLDVYDYGIVVLIESESSNNPIKKYGMRRFKFTPKYQTYVSLVQRIESYYKIN